MARNSLPTNIPLWLIWLGTLCGQFTGAFYHLSSPLHPCRVTSPENGTVDVICQYQEGFVTLPPHGAVVACETQKVIWQRADHHIRATNITDTTKYGVWEAVPGWKMNTGHRISLLRIRNLQHEDIGRYQCRIQCKGPDGRIQANYHMAEVCVQQGDTAYSVCGAPLLDNKCAWAFSNGICDHECDNEPNLYDGLDCAPALPGCHGEDGCRRDFANGVCDLECNAAACSYDGGDCINRQLVFADDKIVITLAPWYQRSGKTVDLKRFGRALSQLLRTIVRVMPGDDAADDPDDVSPWHRPDRRGHRATRKLHVKLDNTMCVHRCFQRAEYAAKFIDMSINKGWDPGIPISSIGVLAKTLNKCALENNTLLHIDLPVAPQKDTNPNIYSYTYAETTIESSVPPTWLLVTAVIGGVVIVMLVVIIVVIILRIRKLSQEETVTSRAAVDRIHEKTMAQQGTDV